MSDTTDFGVDVSTFVNGDVDPLLGPLTGRAVVAEAIARRYLTPRGLLPEDPDYGYDTRTLLGASLGSVELFVVRAQLVAEAEKDERVTSASVALAFNQAAESLTITVRLVTLAGPFTLVLDVSAAALALRVET